MIPPATTPGGGGDLDVVKTRPRVTVGETTAPSNSTDISVLASDKTPGGGETQAASLKSDDFPLKPLCLWPFAVQNTIKKKKTDEERREGANERKKRYRERQKEKKNALKAFIESARPGEAKNLEEGQLNQLFDLMQSSGETIKSGGLPVFFCPPFATNMANFTGWSHEAIDLQPWSSPDFEGLVESIVVQLAGKKKKSLYRPSILQQHRP